MSDANRLPPSAADLDPTEDATHKPQPDPSEEQRAAGLLTALRRQITRAMIEFLVENEDRYLGADPDERYNFALQELEEKFLSKIGIIRRALAEVYTTPQMTASVTNHVKHIRVASADNIEAEVAKVVKGLGRVTLSNMAIAPSEQGFEVVLTYQQVKRKEPHMPPTDE